jgi:hypothetical protein
VGFEPAPKGGEGSGETAALAASAAARVEPRGQKSVFFFAAARLYADFRTC